MICIIIILFALTSAILVCSAVKYRRYKRRVAEINQLAYERLISYKSDFSVYDYCDRIEKVCIKIMREREKKPAYVLTLWAGLDGLRLNEGGTTEWIRREEEKPELINVSYSPCQSMAQSTVSPYVGCQNVAAEIDNQIRTLQSQIDACCVQQTLNIQYSQMMNAIRPLPYPQYPYWTPYLISYSSIANQNIHTF